MSVINKIRDKIFKHKDTSSNFMPPQYKNIELGNLIFGHSRGNYSIDRDQLQPVFLDFLERNYFNAYGFRYDANQNQYPVYDDHASCKTEVFEIRPYYWGDNIDIKELPNFVYYPTNLHISWYKYPLRDAYSSYMLTKEELIQILKECEESIS